MAEDAVKPVSGKQAPQEVAQNGQEGLVHPLEKKATTMKNNSSVLTFAVWLVCIVAGVGTGFAVSQKIAAGGGTTAPGSGFVQTEKTVGSTDTKTFKDSAEGILEKGGMNGEGTHQLVREGGPSQTAYLTSSVVDLDEYVGKKVKIWGQTMAAKKVSWLMDVGKIELME